MYTFWTGKIILSFFLYFLGFFEEKKSHFLKKLHKFIHNSTDHQVQFFKGFAIFHRPKHTQGLWKIAKKDIPIVKFGCGSDCIKV